MHPKVRDAPARTKLVYNALDRDGSLTQQELIDETQLTGPIVRHALDDLREADLLREDNKTSDARQTIYSIKR